MKKILLPLGLLIGLVTQSEAAIPYAGSNFNEVWKAIESDPYKLPNYKISYRSLIKYGVQTRAKQTISDRTDLMSGYFVKLAHPNGICLKGRWNIDTESDYTGYFKKGSNGLIIGRASVAMSGTTVGKYRGFAMAGKIYPTNNPETGQKLETANFFTVDDLGGTKARHYTDVGMTNEPAVSKNSSVLRSILYAAKLAKTFGIADKNPGMRQLYQISELGEPAGTQIITPKWIMIKAKANQTVDAHDFRDELNIDNYGAELIFDILVANTDLENSGKNWQRIGSITYTDSEVSKSCDKRLHFNHAKWRENLVYSL